MFVELYISSPSNMIVIGLFPGFIVVFLIVSVLFSVFWFSSISVAFIFSWSMFVIVWFCAIICYFPGSSCSSIVIVSLLFIVTGYVCLFIVIVAVPSTFEVIFTVILFGYLWLVMLNWSMYSSFTFIVVFVGLYISSPSNIIVIGLFPGFIVLFSVFSVLFSVFWFSSISVAFIFSWSMFVIVWFCAIICVLLL